jgi:hypothetical protein
MRADLAMLNRLIVMGKACGQGMVPVVRQTISSGGLDAWSHVVAVTTGRRSFG